MFHTFSLVLNTGFKGRGKKRLSLKGRNADIPLSFNGGVTALDPAGLSTTGDDGEDIVLVMPET